MCGDGECGQICPESDKALTLMMQTGDSIGKDK